MDGAGTLIRTHETIESIPQLVFQSPSDPLRSTHGGVNSVVWCVRKKTLLHSLHQRVQIVQCMLTQNLLVEKEMTTDASSEEETQI